MTTRPASAPTEPDLEPFRRELTGYCYRMLGSGSEAEDAVQETMLRAWRSYDRFEGRSALRSWVYRIATNVCLDQLDGRQRRARPMDLGPSSDNATAVLGPHLGQETWVLPVPDSLVLPEAGDPADRAVQRETIRLAFVAALQHLPPRQRAVLILREVLRWQATEVAELLDTSVASVNSALQRARATIASVGVNADTTDRSDVDAAQAELLARYVDAFERYDMDALVTLLRDDVVLSMPPFALWLEGRDELIGWFVGQGGGCRGSRLVPVHANGEIAFASYKPSETGDGFDPWAIQVLEWKDGRIAGHHNFLHFMDVDLFAAFGLPSHLDP